MRLTAVWAITVRASRNLCLVTLQLLVQGRPVFVFMFYTFYIFMFIRNVYWVLQRWFSSSLITIFSVPHKAGWAAKPPESAGHYPVPRPRISRSPGPKCILQLAPKWLLHSRVNTCRWAPKNHWSVVALAQKLGAVPEFAVHLLSGNSIPLTLHFKYFIDPLSPPLAWMPDYFSQRNEILFWHDLGIYEISIEWVVKWMNEK